MEDPPDNNHNTEGSGEPDFSFAFDNSQFSDRVLRMEISVSNGDGCHIVEEQEKDPKRRRIYNEEENDDWNVDGKILSSWDMDCPTVLRVRTVQVNSAILASKSPFFYKLFTNGMRESKQRDVPLHISCSEEVAFMDLLNFIYCGTVNAESTTALLDVLLIADKFEVASCMHPCVGALLSLSMTIEYASLVLDLPSSLCMVDAVQPLINTTKGFLTKYFSTIKEFKEEHMNLPLTIIEEMLSSDELRVRLEDALYDFVIMWSKKHYCNDEDRRCILSSKLGHLLRFPHMTKKKRKEILFHTDLDFSSALKRVSEALPLKQKLPAKRRITP